MAGEADIDEFADAFAEAVATVEDKKDPDPADKKDPDPADKKDPEPADKKDPEPADKKDPDPADKKDPEPADKKDPEPEKVTPPAPEPKKKDPDPEPEPVKFEIPDFTPTEEQKQRLEALRKDWPDVAAAMEVEIAQLTHQLKKSYSLALYDALKQVYADMAPISKAAEQSDEDRHFSAITRAHSDFDTLTKPDAKGVSPLKAWIAEQPRILREAYTKVYTDGNAQDVIDLVDAYKQATGKAGGAPKTGDDATGGKPDEGKKPDPAKAAKADALTPVPSKRTTVATKGVDPNDFDAAFEEAAAAISAAGKRR